jgi:hypothetical protein
MMDDTERAQILSDALRYIASPTMGFPGGVDPAEFALNGATTERAVRLALSTCIRLAREALAKAEVRRG